MSHAPSSSLIDSDEDMSDDPNSSDDDAMEEIAMYGSPRTDPQDRAADQPPARVGSPITLSPANPSSSPDDVGAFPQRSSSWSSEQDAPQTRPRSSSSRRSRRRSLRDIPPSRPVLGERLKQRFLEVNVASTLLVRADPTSHLQRCLTPYVQDLFFEFPWNNFLHSVVYDLIHQILTGRVDGGFNRELTVALFRDARLMHRIIEGSKRNDAERYDVYVSRL